MDAEGLSPSPGRPVAFVCAPRQGHIRRVKVPDATVGEVSGKLISSTYFWSIHPFPRISVQILSLETKVSTIRIKCNGVVLRHGAC